MGVVGASALLFGRLYDRFGIVVLAWGILLSMLSLPLGFLGGSRSIVLAVACWGIGIGVQDASLRAGIAQVVSMNKRGTAFGAFNGVYGVAWFAGSVLMGWLYDKSIPLLVRIWRRCTTARSGVVLLAATAAACGDRRGGQGLTHASLRSRSVR